MENQELKERYSQTSSGQTSSGQTSECAYKHVNIFTL